MSLLAALGSTVSDHCPLLLDLNAEFRSRKRFRFESFWPRVDGFFDMVEVAWNSVPSTGNAFVALDNKLRATAKALQGWGDKWIGNVKLQILVSLEIIARLDMPVDTRPL